MAAITENGIKIKRFEEIVTELETGFRQIYGADINLNADTPDGQLIGLIAQMRTDYEEFAETLYKQLDPDLASGAWLEQRTAYAGITRKRSSYSYLRSVKLTGRANTKIPKGLVLSDTNGVRWVLDYDVVLDKNGIANADFRSEQQGAFGLEVNDELTIETIIVGLSGAINQQKADIGFEEETDSRLRSRFFLSRHKNAINGILSLQGKLASLSGVEKVKVYENTESTIKNGIAAHSIAVSIVGGENNDIAKTIIDNKPAGVPMNGDTSATVRIDNQDFKANFYRPKPVDISIHIVAVRDLDFTEIDQPAIKAALAAQNFDIGQTVTVSRLYSPINTVGGFWVKELKIGRKGSTLQTGNIAINFKEYARILESDITIEVQ